MTEYHAPENGDLFATSAACGATTDTDGVLRMHQPGLEVTCTECRRIALEENR